MLFALSTDHEIGLATAGGLFIVFSLLSSFVFPRFIPDFPTKKGLRWYLPLCAVFFIGMLSSILIFGREKKNAALAATTPSATATTATTAGGGLLTSGPYANGDPAAGKVVFTTAGGCTACHTFKAAGSTGTIGPDLDQLASYAAQAKQPLGQFTVNSITKPPPAYVPPGYPSNVMPATFGTSLTQKQIADLVAFLDQPA